MRQNTTDARYDQTRYENFDPAMVARDCADDLVDEGKISNSWGYNRLVNHFEDSDARSVAEMMEEVWASFPYTGHLAAIAEMHADRLHVRVSPEEQEQEQCECECDGFEEPDASFGIKVVNTLAERGEWGAIHYTTDNARDLSGFGPVGVAAELDHEADPADMDAVEEVADAIVTSYTETDAGRYYGPDASDDEGDDADAEGSMVISIVHRDGSGVDENVRKYEKAAGGLIVEYRDGSKAVYADGEVVKAWDSPDAVGADE